MIYLKSLLIPHQEVIMLSLFQNTVNITTYNISTIQQTIALRTMLFPQKTEPIYKYLALEESNQQQLNKFWNIYQVNNSH